MSQFCPLLLQKSLLSLLHIHISFSIFPLSWGESSNAVQDLSIAQSRAVCHVLRTAAGMQGALEDGWKDWQKMTECGRGKISSRRKALKVGQRAKQVKHLSAVWKNSHSLEALTPAREYQTLTQRWVLCFVNAFCCHQWSKDTESKHPFYEARLLFRK